MLHLPEDAWFDVRLIHKDIRLALSMAGELDIPLPSAEVADKALARAEELGYGQRDIAALYEVLTRHRWMMKVVQERTARKGASLC